MLTFEIRADYDDGTFDVLHVESDNYGSALAEVRLDPNVESAFVLATVDHSPIEPLVRFA